MATRREPELKAFLAHLPLFDGLSAADVERIAAGTTRRRLRRGDTLFRQGERPTGLYAMVFGRVALTVRRARGHERVAEILGAGRTFGETVMFLDKPYIVGARAMSDALVLHVAKDTILAELERSAGFARRMIAGLAAKLHATVSELDLYALGSGGQRFAAWLLRAAGDGDAAATVVLPGSKRAIASKLNLSAEHLSRVLRTLSDKGLIRIAGRTLEIPDRARLREWAQA